MERPLNETFEQILVTLGSLDNFGRLHSPSVFLVYAHDKPNAANKYDQCVLHLVEWLQRVGAHILSDCSLLPTVSTRHNGAEAVRDILQSDLSAATGLRQYEARACYQQRRQGFTVWL